MDKHTPTPYKIETRCIWNEDLEDEQQTVYDIIDQDGEFIYTGTDYETACRFEQANATHLTAIALLEEAISRLNGGKPNNVWRGMRGIDCDAIALAESALKKACFMNQTPIDPKLARAVLDRERCLKALKLVYALIWGRHPGGVVPEDYARVKHEIEQAIHSTPDSESIKDKAMNNAYDALRDGQSQLATRILAEALGYEPRSEN